MNSLQLSFLICVLIIMFIWSFWFFATYWENMFPRQSKAKRKIIGIGDDGEWLIEDCQD